MNIEQFPLSVLGIKQRFSHKPNASFIISKFLMDNLIPRYKKLYRGKEYSEKYLYSSNNFDPYIVDPTEFFDTSLNYRFLSFNHNISLEYLSNHMDKPWNWSYITFMIFQTNPYEKAEDFVVCHPNIPWDTHSLGYAIRSKRILSMFPLNIWEWKYLSSNPNLMNYEIILEYLPRIDMNIACSYIGTDTIDSILSISENPNRTSREIELYNRINWRTLSMNKDIREYHIMKFSSSRDKWNLQYILYHNWISTNFILQVKDILTERDKFSILTSNAKINCHYIYRELNLYSTIKNLIENETYPRTFKIKKEFLQIYIDSSQQVLKDFPYLFEHLHMSLVVRYYDLIHYHYLSKNPDLSHLFIIDNIDKPWNWEEISKNFSIDSRLYEFLVRNSTRYADILEKIRWKSVNYSTMREETIILLQQKGIEISKHELSRNYYLSQDYIHKHPYNFTPSIINSPKVSLEFIEKHYDMFKEQPLTTIFNASIERHTIESAIRKYVAGITIHRILRMCIYNPRYAFARKWISRIYHKD
jgi:hypothetical protein